MGDLLKVGDRVAPRPSMMESVRVAAYSAGALTLAFAAVAGNTGSPVDNGRTLGLLGIAGAVAACATRDAIKPDDEEEARAAQHILETEAAELRAEAIDAWKNSNLMAFIRGERPPDEWVSAWVRHNFAEETPALPQASAPVFSPAQYQPEFNPSIMQSDFEDDYEPAPVARSAPMAMAQAQPVSGGSLASRFGRHAEPVAIDPIVAKYGKTIASITDMHSPHSKPRHLAFLAVTQCGKTTTLGAVSYALMERYPESVFVALDGKNSEWAPFYASTVYPGLLSTYDPKAVIEFLQDAGNELEDRVSRKAKNESRLFVILDEWNSVRDELKAFNSDMCAEADLIVNALVLRGLEYGIHVIIVCQEVNCTKLGFTDAGRGNVHFLALGRSGDKTMVDLLLSGEQILKSKPQREQLQQDFLKVWNDTSRPGMSPVLVDSRAYAAEALPNFSGMIQLVKNDPAPRPRAIPIAQPKPRSSQPMLSLAPQGGIHDDRAAATSLMLPEVTHYQQSIDGTALTLTDPALLDLLTSGRSPYLPVIVRQAQKGTSQAAEGTTTVREIQSKAPHNKALQSSDGTPFTADIIRRAMAFLAESYPRSFVFDGQTLTIIDPALIEADI